MADNACLIADKLDSSAGDVRVNYTLRAPLSLSLSLFISLSFFFSLSLYIANIWEHTRTLDVRMHTLHVHYIRILYLLTRCNLRAFFLFVKFVTYYYIGAKEKYKLLFSEK